MHQSGSVTDLARILDCVLNIRERSLGVTKTKQGVRPMAQDCHTGVLTETHGQGTMLGGIIKRERLIIVGPASRDVSRVRQGDSHEAMPDHERDCCPLLLRERQKLRCKTAYHVAAERHVVCDPKGIE